jgi:hypothetical protein
MDESLSNWLALREAADTAARSVALTRVIADALPEARPLRVLDLATGTGSNVRYLSRYLPHQQDWLVVDSDLALLASVPSRMTSWDEAQGLVRHVEARQLNLGEPDHPEIYAGRHLVTASALLDLVSEGWLQALAARCRESGAAALFALTYNGRSQCSPTELEDDMIRDLMNRHQKSNDKGFGRAAGPDAVDCAERCFVAAGYHVRRDTSDWVLPPEARDLQRQLIGGWADAAAAVAPEQAATIADWRMRRLAHVDANRSHIEVGHEDLAAWLSR